VGTVGVEALVALYAGFGRTTCYVNLQEKRKTLPLSGTAHRLLHFPFCIFHAVLNPACGRLTNDRKLLG
jgi:hypothetical protein